MSKTFPAYHPKENINYHPHVVILGAGASRAAFPNGDKHGRKLPVLNELIEVVGLENELKSLGIKPPVPDFEATFDYLSRTKPKAAGLQQIREKMYSYFASLELPDELTLYDRLVLSLRPKDIIATFNWDPLLGLAFQRNRYLKELPQLAFLHGNVFQGICPKHKIRGFTNCVCSKCGDPFRPTQLLYPVKDKDYEASEEIRKEWDVFRHLLEHAFVITIFGYSAPKTDVAARQVLFDFWSKNRIRDLGQIEIIDVKPEDVIEDTWSEFFVRNHYDIVSDFKDSYVNVFPRRSCEAFASAYLQNDPWNRFKSYMGNSLREYQNLIHALVNSEIARAEDKSLPLSRWP